MKAKKVIISIFNILFIILCLGIVTLGVFSLIQVIIGKGFVKEGIGKFIGDSANAIFTPINDSVSSLFRPMKIDVNILKMIAIITPTAISLLLAVFSLIVMIKVLRDKNCKVTSIINMILSILGFALVLACLFVLISNKFIKNLMPFLQSNWLFITFGGASLLSFGTALIACITSGYVPKSQMANVPNQQGNQFNGYANNPQVTQAQPQANPMQAGAQPYPTQTGQYVQPNQATAQPNQYGQPQTDLSQMGTTSPETSQMNTTQATPFVSSVQPPSNPFEPTPSATNNAFTNPTGSYSTTQTSYTNPAGAYSANPTTSYTNPATTYQTGATQPTTPYPTSTPYVAPTPTDMPAGTTSSVNPNQTNAGFPTDPNNQ